MNFASELRVKLRSLLFTALIRVPSTASSSRSNRSSRLHSRVNARNTALNAARLSARKSAMVLKSGFSVRSSQITSMQPDHLDVAVTLGLKPTARTHSVQVSVDVKLQQIARRVAR